MVIIGITGTLGAGKGTLVDYLINEQGFVHYSAREFIVNEITHRGLEVNRDSMTSVANELRAMHSPAYVIEELYRLAFSSGKNAVIESIRTPGEIEFLKKQGNFILVAVDADPQTRYNRIALRASETDHVSYETFTSNENREFSTTDPNKQNLGKCIAMADIVLNNNGTVEELYTSFVEEMKKKGWSV
ncbi:MAG: AAA family ATPase [Bacteroidales bacterium]|nr:AAA family ATPase [Bacteroidales bacterium]